MTLSERVKAEARRIGFTHAGIARVEPLEKEGDRLREWLQREYHAGMGWMGRRAEERIDLEKVLPGARSVISVAENYYWPAERIPAPQNGAISRYAWGDDYHDVILARLRRLELWLGEAIPGTVSRAYVDTGPVMEKAWAARAGIGWIGKHTNLITTDTGSWVFLGELLTTAELAPDAPATDHCGTCTRCIEACPTGAIVEPYVLDANRCISYLNIEHRGEFGPGQGEMLAEWIYGCDICQDVCPWNERFARPTAEARYAPRAGMVDPDLAAMRRLGESGFLQATEGSAMRRPGWSGFLRNILAVLKRGGAADPRGEERASHTS